MCVRVCVCVCVCRARCVYRIRIRPVQSTSTYRHTDILRTDVQMYSRLVGDKIEDCVSQGKQRQTPYVDEEEFLSSSPIIIIIAIIIHAVRTKL